jgi:hypothetical protein
MHIRINFDFLSEMLDFVVFLLQSAKTLISIIEDFKNLVIIFVVGQ